MLCVARRYEYKEFFFIVLAWTMHTYCDLLRLLVLISSIKYMYEINKQIAIKNNKHESFDEAQEVWTNLFM
jgi:hypothetical protein